MAAVLSGTLLKSSKNHGLSRALVVSAKFSTSEKRSATAEGSKNPLFDPKLSALKRGTGGRSSFNGIVATVFGASGFLGPLVCNKLGKSGTQIIIPYRGDHYEVLKLKLVGDLGQVLFFPFYLKDEASVRKAMYRSNVVINLIGRDWETKNFSFNDVHVTGARTIARLARECGVKRLIHISALNSAEHPKPIILKEGSKFLSSKYHGEIAVREEYPDATILRPSDCWGENDRFIFTYVHAWRRRRLTQISIWHKGEKTEKQPVHSHDVAQAVINALRDPDTVGKTYDLVGPNRYQLSELVDYIFRVLRRSAEFEEYKRYDLKWDILGRLKTTLTEKLPSWPIAFVTWDKMEREVTSDTLLGNPTFEDLGITPITLESRIEYELKGYRNFNYYAEQLGEFPPAAHPKLVVPIDD